MKNFPVEKIPRPSYFTKPVYIDEKFIVSAPETPFTDELEKALSEWGFTEVLSDGEPRENYVPEEESTGLENEITDRSTASDPDKIQQAERFYVSFQRYVSSIYKYVGMRNTINFDTIAEKIKTACNTIREGHRFLMQVQRLAEPSDDENYLVSHTVRSTIIAIIIGIYLKLPNHRLIELGVSALLHEIGMLNLAPETYLSGRQLTKQEKKNLYSHPIYGYNFLKSCNFPLVVSLAVLEHHERENGTGYPQKLAGDKIGLYAKIIAVACSYEAISAERPHKEAKDGYTGMLELMKNEGKQYNDTIIRALVYSLSIYPIGLYVMLSSGKKGQVVDINPENPRYPVVQVFGELLPDGKNKTVQTAPDGLAITRPLTHEEIEG